MEFFFKSVITFKIMVFRLQLFVNELLFSHVYLKIPFIPTYTNFFMDQNVNYP